MREIILDVALALIIALALLVAILYGLDALVQ